MGLDFTFRIAETEKDIFKLIDFMRKQDLNYPNYQDWVSKSELEVKMGWKTGIIAISNGYVIGNVIWQPHKEIKEVREIKNLRIHPEFRERYFARFLMKQAEVENKDYSILMLDLREDHPDKNPLVYMLTSTDYKKNQVTNLYEPDIKDIVMIKKVA